jgi:hypothetical protein
MIKKLFSRALLSMVIDKKARETLEKRRSAKPGPADPDAGGKVKAPAPAAPGPTGDPLDDLPETLIRQAIDEASREVDRRTTAARGGPGSDRARLIQDAIDIQKRQSRLLDELPREQREKLVVMAHQALVGDVEKAQAARAKGKKKPPKVKG